MPTKLPWPMRREPNAAYCARILFSSCTPSSHSLRGDTDHSLYRLSQKLIDKRTDTPCLTKRRNSKSRFALGRPAYDGSEKPKTFNFPAKFCRNLRIAGQKSASCTACAPLSSFLEAVRVSIPCCCQINLYYIRNLLSFNVIARKSLIFRHILIALILYRCTYGRSTASQRLHPASCHFCASIAH